MAALRLNEMFTNAYTHVYVDAMETWKMEKDSGTPSLMVSRVPRL